MASKENDYSLLETAITLLSKKKKPQLLTDIIKDVMSSKGYKAKQAKEEAPQFILDFQSCGNFIYCGDGKWDLKDRQPTSVLDKDGGEYEDIFEEDEDVLKNELKDDDYIQVHEDDEIVEDHLVERVTDEEEEEEDEGEEDDLDDLSAEFETGDDETDELTDDNDDLAYSDDDDVNDEVDAEGESLDTDQDTEDDADTEDEGHKE